MKKLKINIVLTDDHNLFRKGLKAILNDFDFINHIYEAENGIELLKLLKTLERDPDIIFLDLRMPEMDGIEVFPKIKQRYPGIKVVILTMDDDEQIILHMINEGANGYLLKNSEPEEIETALKKLIEQEFYFGDDIKDLILRNHQLNRRPIYEHREELNLREIEILQLICRGYTAAQMAERLSLSARTIEGYRRKLLEKTGTRNIAGLVIFAIKNNLIVL